MTVRSLAVSDMSGVEECNSPMSLALSGESIGTRLNSTPCGDKVNGAGPSGEGAKCPVTGQIWLLPFPEALTVGECPLSGLFCLLCGTGEWEQ